MQRLVVAVLFGVALSASALATESTVDSVEDAAAPVCKRAMVSPGTGTVICIDPFGAAVEAPPPQEEPCKPGKQTGGIWTPGSGCSEE